MELGCDEEKERGLGTGHGGAKEDRAGLCLCTKMLNCATRTGSRPEDQGGNVGPAGTVYRSVVFCGSLCSLVSLSFMSQRRCAITW